MFNLKFNEEVATFVDNSVYEVIRESGIQQSLKLVILLSRSTLAPYSKDLVVSESSLQFC